MPWAKWIATRIRMAKTKTAMVRNQMKLAMMMTSSQAAPTPMIKCLMATKVVMSS